MTATKWELLERVRYDDAAMKRAAWALADKIEGYSIAYLKDAFLAALVAALTEQPKEAGRDA